MEALHQFTNDIRAEGFPSAAVAPLQQALEKNADDAWALHGWALIKIDSGDYAEALAALQRALNLAPEFTLALRTLSRLYGLVGWEELRVKAQACAEVLEQEALTLAEQRRQNCQMISRLLIFNQLTEPKPPAPIG